MPYGATCAYLMENDKQCGLYADFGISWRDDDSGKENSVWYCLPHFKEMRSAGNKLDLLSAHIVSMAFDENQ